jgi:5'-deoxynucleotidase YfbR-like HD superfamily hydrolase
MEEEREFEELLLENRHNQILQELREVVKAISEKNSDMEGVLTKKLDTLTKFLKSFEFPEIEVVTKSEDFKMFFETIKDEILKSNNKVIDTIENRLLPDSFDLQRGKDNLTTSVKINYKTAKEIK